MRSSLCTLCTKVKVPRNLAPSPDVFRELLGLDVAAADHGRDGARPARRGRASPRRSSPRRSVRRPAGRGGRASRPRAAMASSGTATSSSTKRWTCAKVTSPARRFISPSAMLDDAVERHRVAGIERRAHLRGADCGSTPTTRTAGPRLLDRRRDAGNQAAAAHRHEHRAEVGHLLEQLEGHRALAGDDHRVIEGRDDRQAARRGLGLGAPLPVERRRALEDHLGAVGPHAVDLHRRARSSASPPPPARPSPAPPSPRPGRGCPTSR